MPSAALVFRATCGCFHPVFQAFMMKRAKEKANMHMAVLSSRSHTDGVILGLLLTMLFWGGFLLRCGDVEQNPGPPKLDPTKQTRQVTSGRRTSLDLTDSTSGSGQSSPPPLSPTTPMLMDLTTPENTMNTASCSKGGPQTSPSSSVSSTTSPPISTGATPSQADTNPPTQVRPSEPWKLFVKGAFPNLHTQPYFLPPFILNKVPYYPENIDGNTVQVLGRPTTPNLQTAESHPTHRKSNKGGPPADSQVAGLVFTENPQNMKISKPAESDLQGKRAQRHALNCLKAFAEATKQVMIVISELTFRTYLDKVTDPLCAAKKAMSLQTNTPQPSHEDQSKNDCESDIIVIHRRYGIIDGEIKSVGEKTLENTKPNTIRNEVDKLVKQLNIRSKVLNDLVSDLKVKVTMVVILPNITSSQLEKTLDSFDKLNKDLCQCLGVQDKASAVKRCLCKDMMPDTQQLQHSADTSDVSSSGDWMTALTSWWEDTVVEPGEDSAMTPDMYERLVAWFCGSASTVEIYTPCPPRKEIRMYWEAVAEAGMRLSRLALYPQQVDILNSDQPPCVYLCGPPGTGKTVVLVLKALQWLNQDKHVHLVSIFPESRAVTILMHHQLRKMAPEKTNLLHYHSFNFLEKPEDVGNAVKELTAPGFDNLHLVIDEMLVDSVIKFVTQLKDKLQGTPHTVFVWCAGLQLLSSTEIFHTCSLTFPLRCPPAVHEQVSKSPLLTGMINIQLYRNRLESMTHQHFMRQINLHLHTVSQYTRGNPVFDFVYNLILGALTSADPEYLRQLVLNCLDSVPQTLSLSSLVSQYTSPSTPAVSDGPEVKWLKHAGQPGHSGTSPLHCGKCGELVVRELRDELRVHWPVCRRTETPSPTTPGTTTTVGGHLQCRDIFILTTEPTVDAPMVRELSSKYPVKVIDWSDDSAITDVALANDNSVIVATPEALSGLERRVVFAMESTGADDRLWIMSRCNSQLFWFDKPSE